MSHYFLDSSALIKRYIEEPGTFWIRRITASALKHDIVIAPITRVEVVSGIMRLMREGALEKSAAQLIRLLVDDHADFDYLEIALTRGIIELAEDLLERYSLRAYDAIQLASALAGDAHITGESPLRLEFVSADARLLAAAASEGLTTIDPSTRS